MIKQIYTGLRKITAAKTKAPHFALPSDDYCLAVPFNYDLEDIQPLPVIAVICHIYYTDLIEELKRYFFNIPYPFDLFITTDTKDKKQEIEKAFFLWNPGKVEVRLASNRGRNIAPALITCRDVFARYEYLLHVHTKKTLQDENLVNWRTYLLESLLGSENIVKSIFEAFKCDKKLGMIAPQHYVETNSFIGWGWNFNNAKVFARNMGIKISLKRRIDFPSGAMFWARSGSIKPLLDLGITISDFPEETRQTDNTISHVIERLFFFSCEKAGLRWIKIINPLVYLNAKRCIDVNSQNQLMDIIKQVQRPLLVSKKRTINLSLIKKIFSVVFKQKFYQILKGLFFNKIVKHLNKKWYYHKFYKYSAYKNMSFDEFQKQVDFDEDFYLKANKDVADMINSGVFENGYNHYCLWGKGENRLWSNSQITHKFLMAPNYPEGMFEPVNIKYPPVFRPFLADLPKSEKPFLLILFSHLQRDLFFAGYSEFFHDFLPVFERFSKIVLSIENTSFESRLATRFSQKIEVIQQKKLSGLKVRPDIIVGFNTSLFMKAYQLLNDVNHIVYYCQEYEAGFFPFGAKFIEAEKAIAYSKNIILSTVLLKNFLGSKNLLTDKHVFTTSPKIECFDVMPGKNKRLFFYFRPESFNSRNIPEILWEAVHEFCNKHQGYEIYLIGTVDTRFSVEINNTRVYVINKLPKKEYLELISSCDAVIAMIYSAHPGVIAFQAAASGIPTVTNIFENRSSSLLKQISDNIVPYDPVRESLLTKIEEALGMPKGIKSFNEILYSGEKESITLSEYIAEIQK